MRGLIGSLSFRLALTYVGLFVTSLLVVLGTYYAIVIAAPLDRATTQVKREAQVLANIYIVDGQGALLAALRERDRVPHVRKPFHAFINADGKVVSTDLPSWPRHSSDRMLWLEADDYLDGEEIDYEVLTVDRTFEDGARLLVGADIQDIAGVQEPLFAGAPIVLAISVVVGLLGGALMSRAIGRRIEAVGRTARQVMAGDLSQRVPVRGSSDDFDRLAETLNLMLGRIEQAVEAVRRVSDSVAHELRTPLARLKAELEEVASTPQPVKERMAVAVAEAERLEKIFDAVLRIARIEARRHAATMSPVAFTTLLEDAADYYRPAAEERGIEISTDIAPDLLLQGDRDLLFQAVANLLDNAIKFSPLGGVISLVAAREGDHLTLLLSDEGSGIPAAERERVTERFYRGTTAEATEGAGLGLSLVGAVADVHPSTLSFEDARPGLRVRWTFRIADDR